MLGYQPWRCMKHNSIAVKPRWFLKIVWGNFLLSNLRFFFYVRIVKGPKSNIFTCKLWARVIFITLFTRLLCDNSNFLTYEPRKDQSPTLSRANCVILHLMLAFDSKARFKRRATAVPNSIDRIKFDFSTAVARLGFKRHATAVPNSIHKLQIH